MEKGKEISSSYARLFLPHLLSLLKQFSSPRAKFRGRERSEETTEMEKYVIEIKSVGRMATT